MNKEFEVICINDKEFEHFTFRKGQTYLAVEHKFDPIDVDGKLDENYTSVRYTYSYIAFWIKTQHRQWTRFSDHFLTLITLLILFDETQTL